jgi:hypothetical protein
MYKDLIWLMRAMAIPVGAARGVMSLSSQVGEDTIESC